MQYALEEKGTATAQAPPPEGIQMTSAAAIALGMIGVAADDPDELRQTVAQAKPASQVAPEAVAGRPDGVRKEIQEQKPSKGRWADLEGEDVCWAGGTNAETTGAAAGATGMRSRTRRALRGESGRAGAGQGRQGGRGKGDYLGLPRRWPANAPRTGHPQFGEDGAQDPEAAADVG